MTGPLAIAVLVKQIPRFENFEIGPDGRLVREGLALEMNPYCRRAVAKGVELASVTGGRCTVITLGPPSAEDCLREAIACGADEGVLVTDRVFSGSDTLATSRALAAAIRAIGPFDLVLCGKNSVDADTGQTPPEVAQLLDLPFAAGARAVELVDDRMQVRCEHDDGWSARRLRLPALLSCAERLCAPAKAEPEERAAVAASSVRRLSASDLGVGPWGEEGSPTVVGRVERLAINRLRACVDGDVDAQVRAAAQILGERRALSASTTSHDVGQVVQARRGTDPPRIVVVVEPNRERIARELLGAAARLGRSTSRAVTAFAPAELDPETCGGWGADTVIRVVGADMEEDVAAALAQWGELNTPWAVLGPGTLWGREVLGRAAARLGAGLVGDTVDLQVDGNRLVCWKPAFGGALVAAVTCRTAIQMATVRAGVFPLLEPRAHRARSEPDIVAVPRRRIELLEEHREDDLECLASADVVVTVGQAVEPASYVRIQPLLDALGAELGATRKVIDNGWLPRSRQVGITGRSVAPRLYVAVGVAGKFNHAVGARAAGTILAINSDPTAPIFENADIGIVGDWREVVPRLAEAITALRAGEPAPSRACSSFGT